MKPDTGLGIHDDILQSQGSRCMDKERMSQRIIQDQGELILQLQGEVARLKHTIDELNDERLENKIIREED